jgi:hypothetical protein
MADYITLLGAEQVSNAASTMRGAADEMQRAATNMSAALERHERFMSQWLVDFQTVCEAIVDRISDDG